MTKLFHKDKPLFGLDITHSGIKAMAIDSKRLTVAGYGSIDLEPVRVKEALEVAGKSYLTDNIKLLMSEKIIGTIHSKQVAIAAPTARSFSRTFILPTSVEKRLKEAVELEAEQYIPIPIDNLYIDYQIIERHKKEIMVLISAIPKVVIDNLITSVRNAGLEPVLV
ncbi:pilus assembly protein PilM, partial [Candidatus Saccharibacteria bacterium 32-50-13]